MADRGDSYACIKCVKHGIRGALTCVKHISRAKLLIPICTKHI